MTEQAAKGLGVLGSDSVRFLEEQEVRNSGNSNPSDADGGGTADLSGTEGTRDNADLTYDKQHRHDRITGHADWTWRTRSFATKHQQRATRSCKKHTIDNNDAGDQLVDAISARSVQEDQRRPGQQANGEYWRPVTSADARKTRKELPVGGHSEHETRSGEKLSIEHPESGHGYSSRDGAFGFARPNRRHGIRRRRGAPGNPAISQ